MSKAERASNAIVYRQTMYSLRTKLTLTHTLVALLALMLGAMLSVWLINRGFRQLSQIRAQNDAQQVAEALGKIYEAGRPGRGLGLILRQRLQNPGTLPLWSAPVIIADVEQRVVLDRLGDLEGQVLPPRLRQNAAPIMANGRTVGYVALPVERRDLTMVERSVVLRVYAGVACSSVLAGTVALLVGLAISRRLTTPLRSLTAAATRLAAREQLDPVPVVGDLEVAALARAFNTMAGELQRQELLRRNLVADIAHELRTPLSVLRLQVEALQDGIELPTSTVFASLQEEVALLGHLVDDLRLLSLADAGQLAVVLEDVDGVAAARRATAVAEPRARVQQVRLECQVPDALPPLRADSQRLVQVLSGLIDNALRYTPPSGSITLHVTYSTELPALQAKADPPDGGPAKQMLATQPMPLITFAVADSGPGIAAADLPYIFERFYRADRARARETGGSGLGLAIAQRLVEAMHGRIWAESTPGQGARFYVALPACPART